MIDVIVTSLCLQLKNMEDSSKYYPACIESMQAASIQTHLKPTLDNFEQRFNDKVKQETGEAIWWLVGTGYAYYQKGFMTINFKAKPTVDSIELKGSQNNSNINLIWNW